MDKSFARCMKDIQSNMGEPNPFKVKHAKGQLKVIVGKDQEMAQSGKKHSKDRGEKNKLIIMYLY